jgi:hypothetical protein
MHDDAVDVRCARILGKEEGDGSRAVSREAWLSAKMRKRFRRQNT